MLRRLGVENYNLKLNSIGDTNCRPAYVERLSEWLDEHDAELDDEARGKRTTSPLRVFDVKSERVHEALRDAPKIGDSLCDECREHFDRVREYLDAYGVRYELEPTLVRGLDYYTRTTFEFEDEAIGAKSVICGGGRYDGLVEAIGGPPTPGIGFGAGIERLLLSLATRNRRPSRSRRSSSSTKAPIGPRSSRRWPSFDRGASRATPTTRDARRRASSHRRAGSGRA